MPEHSEVLLKEIVMLEARPVLLMFDPEYEKPLEADNEALSEA